MRPCRALGIAGRMRGDTLRFKPYVPPSWPGLELNYQYRSATYQILVDNSAVTGRGVRSVKWDGQLLAINTVPPIVDGNTHNVSVGLG